MARLSPFTKSVKQPLQMNDRRNVKFHLKIEGKGLFKMVLS